MLAAVPTPAALSAPPLGSVSRPSICTFDQAPQGHGPRQAPGRCPRAPYCRSSRTPGLWSSRRAPWPCRKALRPEGAPALTAWASSQVRTWFLHVQSHRLCDLNPRAWSPSAEPGGASDLALPSAEGPCPASLMLSAPGLALSSLSSSPWTRWVRGQELC